MGPMEQIMTASKKTALSIAEVHNYSINVVDIVAQENVFTRMKQQTHGNKHKMQIFYLFMAEFATQVYYINLEILNFVSTK